ncbi:unnamed protein product [Colias eurytheme]|nr:unnamed protein product [Colias eurytheme]
MMESELPPGSCNSTGHLSTIGWNIPGRMHHSASTPAGVDGGGSRTPPATPKKGGKMLAVRVQMLDDSISMFQIQLSTGANGFNYVTFFMWKVASNGCVLSAAAHLHSYHI